MGNSFPDGMWTSQHSEPTQRDDWAVWATTLMLHDGERQKVSEIQMFTTGGPGTVEHGECLDTMTQVLRASAHKLRQTNG